MALIGGILFPVVFTVVVGTLSDFWPAYFPATMTLFGEPAPSLIFAPVASPIYFLMWLASHYYFGFARFWDTLVFRLFLFVIPNVMVYSLVSWVILKLFGVPKGKKIEGILGPPPPPDEWET